MNRYLHMRTYLLSIFVLIFFGNFNVQATEACEPPREKFTVVLDAGHGGQDPGNRGSGFFEKDIALQIVLNIGAELEKLPDVKVIYTRKTDVFVTLAGRAEIANKAEADLFISVHCNAHNSQAHGTETFVLGLHRNEDNLKVAMRENQVIYLEEDYEVTYDGFNPNSPESYIGLTLMQEEYLDQSVLLADYVQKNFTRDLKLTDRGVKQAGFLVLRQTYMPSVLIETGFLTNKTEGTFLNSRSGQDKISDAIVQAVKNYKNSINLEVLEGLAENPPLEVNTQVAIEEPEDVYDNVIFRVQLAATGKKIDPDSRNFKGLPNITRQKEGKLYKYYFGATSSYVQVKELHEIAKEKGFVTSYIVAFRENSKISVNDALKTKVK